MKRRTIHRLMAENNRLSPDILTAIAVPESNPDACLIAGIFLDCTDYKLPFSFEEWRQNVQAPVELYFVFDRKKQLTAFLKEVRKVLPGIRFLT